MSGLRPRIRNSHNSRFREWTKTAIEILSDPTPDMLAMPRFDDDVIDMQALIRRLAEQVANATMDAEADRPCSGGSKSQRLPEEQPRHLRRHADAALPQAPHW